MSAADRKFWGGMVVGGLLYMAAFPNSVGTAIVAPVILVAIWQLIDSK